VGMPARWASKNVWWRVFYKYLDIRTSPASSPLWGCGDFCLRNRSSPHALPTCSFHSAQGSGCENNRVQFFVVPKLGEVEANR
jgi:hypothetical protein